MTTEDHKIITAMRRYGGSFVQQLAECCRCADEQNLTTIKLAFAPIWETYVRLAKIDDERGAQGTGVLEMDREIMSTQHRDNPDSEECQKMEKDNRIAGRIAKMRRCLRCGHLIAPDYPIKTGRCEDCDFEAQTLNYK